MIFKKRFEFLPFWPFLICFDPIIKFKLTIPEEKDSYFDFEIILFNIEILGLYIDKWKIHFGLLGFCFNFWIKSQI